jgi:lipopolysaccharide export system permease protein
MELKDIKERLEKLNSSKLIDVVKNHKQYGYTDDVRAYALTLLEQQGITLEDLHLTGNLENTTYTHANELFLSYKRSSLVALITYCLAILIKALLVYQFIESGKIMSVILIITSILYFIFLIRSFLIQNDFSKLTGTDIGTEAILVYLFLGMPFYIIMYFVFRIQMKERMSLIH